MFNCQPLLTPNRPVRANTFMLNTHGKWQRTGNKASRELRISWYQLVSWFVYFSRGFPFPPKKKRQKGTDRYRKEGIPKVRSPRLFFFFAGIPFRKRGSQLTAFKKASGSNVTRKGPHSETAYKMTSKKLSFTHSFRDPEFQAGECCFPRQG